MMVHELHCITNKQGRIKGKKLARGSGGPKHQVNIYESDGHMIFW